MKDCLSVPNGLVTKGECIVIPKSMQNTVLKRILDAHQGIEKCQLNARNSVYWRRINKDIEMMVRSCEICREHQRKNTKETMIIKEHSEYFRILQLTSLNLMANKFYLLLINTAKCRS